VKGGLAEQLINLVTFEKSEHTVWAHGIRRQILKIPTASDEPLTPPLAFYKIISKTTDHRIVYANAAIITSTSSSGDSTLQPNLMDVVFSPVFSTFDTNEADKILPGKIVCAWDGPDFDGVRVVTRFRVLDENEQGEV